LFRCRFAEEDAACLTGVSVTLDGRTLFFEQGTVLGHGADAKGRGQAFLAVLIHDPYDRSSPT
jgi:hypothetical protein